MAGLTMMPVAWNGSMSVRNLWLTAAYNRQAIGGVSQMISEGGGDGAGCGLAERGLGVGDDVAAHSARAAALAPPPAAPPAALDSLE